jgi:O-antigen ligase
MAPRSESRWERAAHPASTLVKPANRGESGGERRGMGGRKWNREGVIQAPARPRDGLWRRGVAEPQGFVRYTTFAVILTVLGYSLGYSTIGFGLLFLGALWSLGRCRRVPWWHTSIDLPLAVFAAVLLLAAIVSTDREVAGPVTFMLLVSGAVYFGTFTWLLHAVPAARPRLFRAWAIGAVVAAAVGLAYSVLDRFAAHSVLPQGRAEIPRGVGPNGLGTTLMLGGLVALALAFKGKGSERLAWLCAGFLCLAGVLASGSRASLVGWVVGAAYFAWRELRAHPRTLLVACALGLALLGAVTALTPQFSQRLGHTASDVSGNRIRIWQTSFKMVAARPLLGTGFGTFERAYNRWRPSGSSSEPFAFNLWLNLAVETGLLGLAAALWVAFEAVRTWRTDLPRGSGPNIDGAPFDDSWRPLIVALWIGLLVDQFADNTLFSISTSAALWLLLALVVVAPSATAKPPAKVAQ